VSAIIFVDANIPMYLIGADERYRGDARRLVERAITARERLVTNAEVLQEILHRYTAIDQRDAIQPAFDAILGIVDEVFPVTIDEVERAKNIVHGRRKHSARDAIHLATMERNGITRIMTFDRGFDTYPGISRVVP
jgi:predicted nucleic acid-binding protein